MNRFLLVSLMYAALSFSFFPKAFSSSLVISFEKKEIQLGGKKLLVELADTKEKRERGLSGRNTLLEGKGMLFIFDRAKRVSFHMNGVGMPISIGFFNKNRVLEQVEHMVPEGKKKGALYNSKAPVKYALEVPERWFSRNKIALGAKLEGI